MKIVIGSDKAGFALKSSVAAHLTSKTHQFTDIGPENDKERVSFVEIADNLCASIQKNKAELGILVCGTGMGMSLAANKHLGIYAAVVESIYSAKMSRLINNANVLCMGGFIVGPTLANEIVDVFLATEYLYNFEQWRRDFLNEQLAALKKIESINFK